MRMLVLASLALSAAGLMQSKQVQATFRAASALLSPDQIGQSTDSTVHRSASSAGPRLQSNESSPAVAHPLQWDATAKNYAAKPGETRAGFVFTVTNTSTADVVITEVLPSCGCTTATLPSHPWRIAPGAGGVVRLDVDLTGKTGQLDKTVLVETSHGPVELLLHVRMADEAAMRRGRNQQFAATDRQLVFRGDCAKCHAEPVRDKTSGELFTAACGICHAAAERASMVPDLRTTGSNLSAQDWEKWISEGREGSLMPAFSHKRGGPLTDEQIASLVNFLVGQNPIQPVETSP